MFVILTPVHNEITEIDGLVDCIEKSDWQPDLWLFIDDCSDDGTTDRLQAFSRKINYIKTCRITEQANYMEYHISEVLQFGVEQVKKLKIKVKYWGFLDADIRFGEKYWLKLKNYLDEHPETGIVSGILCSQKSGEELKIEPFQRIDNPRGGLRLVKGDCMDQIGGVQYSRSWDSVMNVQARTGSWQIKILESLYALSTRPTDTKLGSKLGELSQGRRAWHLHQPVWQILTRAFFKTLRGNGGNAFAYLKGFFSEWRKQGEKFPDAKLRHYYRYSRTLEWFKSILYKIFARENPHRIVPVRIVKKEEIFDTIQDK